MEKQINYPVKYAVLEVLERGGWAVDYQTVNQGHIVSKCYILESNIIYDYNGKALEFHKVVFPYDDITVFKQSLKNGKHYIGDRNVPTYDANGNPHPVRIVEELYDTYEEAKEKATKKNDNYKRNLINYVSGDNQEIQYELLKKEYDDRVSLSNLYEQLIITKTEDMTVTNDKSQRKVLKP